MSKNSPQNRQEDIYILLKGKTEELAMSASDIHQRLIDIGYEVNLRTVRRDIEVLSEKYGLSSTEGWPERFYIAKDFKFKHEMKLNEQSFQVLLIALHNLRTGAHEYFNDIAINTENVVLDALSPELAQSLKETSKYYYFDYSAAGKPSAKNIKDFQNLMLALRETKVFSCYYQSLNKSKAEAENVVREFEPHLFVMSSSIPYLIVKEISSGDIKKLRCNRIYNIKVTEKVFTRIDQKKFPLEEMFGGWGGIESKATDVVITCKSNMATYFQEKSIHNSQVVELTKNEGEYKIKFKCAMSHEFIRLISSFGDEVIDITPKSIYEEVALIWRSGVKSLKGKKL